MKRHRSTLATTALFLIACYGVLGHAGERRIPGPTAGPLVTSTERGGYLVRAMGCHDCHTPHVPTAKGIEPDMSRALSGHPAGLGMPTPPSLPPGPWVWLGAGTNTAFAGPWGVSFTANLTPDEETGLGRWTEEMFIATMRTGKHQGKGRPILPPMPYQSVAGLSEDDIKAVFAYLRSLPPVRNRVPAPIDPPDGGQ